MEILREVSEEELNYIVKKLEEKLPRTIKDLQFIFAARKSKILSTNLSEVSEKVLPTFYTHRNGLKENCTIFGITGEKDHNVWLFTFQESLEEMIECLEKTKLIRWNNRVLFVTVHRKFVKPIMNRIITAGYDFDEIKDQEVTYYTLSKEKALKFQVKIPEGTEVRQLTDDDTSFCNSIWDFRYDGSELYIKSLIRLNGGLGLFDKSTDQLLSYAIINDHLATGMLNTVTSARGNGYAEIIAKLVAIKIVQDFDINPTVYIDNARFISKKLFAKLGYKKVGDCNWIFIVNKK